MDQQYPWWVVHLDPQEWHSLHETLAEFLSDLPISQQDLARKLNVTQSTISRWSAGKSLPSIPQLRVIVDAVEQRIAFLQQRAQWARRLLDAQKALVHPKRGLQARTAASDRVSKLLAESTGTQKRRSKRKGAKDSRS